MNLAGRGRRPGAPPPARSPDRAPEGARGRTCGHRGRPPRSRGDAGWPARWPGSQPGTLAVGTSPARRGTGGRGQSQGVPGPRPPRGPRPPGWPRTWPAAPLRPFISSRNCILRMTRGSLRGGYGRPVTTTPRAFVSAKSSPSLACGQGRLRAPPPHQPADIRAAPTLAGRVCPPNSSLQACSPREGAGLPRPQRHPQGWGVSRHGWEMGSECGTQTPSLTFPRHTARKAAPRGPGAATLP